MSFLTPLFFLFSLLALPIILLYMLRLRRREVVVSSTMLWQKLLRDREANAPWQKLRRNWLLILQLLILALLVLALARPFLPVPAVVSGNVVVMLDASASMAATDVAPTRFEAAKTEVEAIIGSLGSNRMTLIWVGDVPTVVSSAETNPTLLRDALSETTVSGGSANWQAAFALASGAAQGYREAKIVIVSDGGIETETAILPVEAVYIPIGEAAENVAITALASVEVSNEIDGTQVFARVANTGLGEQSTLLSLFLGNQLFDSRQLTVPAGETVSITFEIPSETAVSDITARLSEQTVDYLPADDVAYAIHEGGVSNRTLLVTDGNLFLEQLLSSIPGIELFKTDDPSGDNSQFDLVVLDQAPLPEGVEAADILWIAPPESDDVITVSGVFTNTATTRIEDDPILTFVDWGGVDVLQAQNVSAGFLRPLITAQGGDLLSVGSQNNRRIAVISFDLLQSDLPLQVAFPILISNLTEWLNPGAVIDAPSGMHVGASVPLAPPAGVERIVITKPDGSVYRADVGDEQLIFSETQASGLYIIETETGLRTTQAGAFAVNLFAESESTIAPQETVQVGFSDLTEETEEAVGQREFWPWLALLALLILVIEWWVYHRGTVLPKLSLPRRT